MQLPALKRNISAASSETITVLSESEQNAFEQNLIRKHLRALTKGTSSRYQRQIILIQCLMWIQITFVSLIGSFVFMNPIFKCKGVETSEDIACSKLKKCKFQNKFTATYTHDLYCEAQDERVMIQSLFPAGCLVGMFLLPWISDQYGRRFAFLLGLFLELGGIIVLLCGLFRDSLIEMYIGQFLLGVFSSGCSVLSYVISSEISTGKLRQSSIMLFNAIWGIGLMSFYLIYEYLPEWHNFLVYLVLIPSLLITAAAYFILMETPDFLLIIDGNLEQYVQMMKRMAIINRSKPGKYKKVFGKKGKYNIFNIFQDKQTAIQTYSSNKKLKNPQNYAPATVSTFSAEQKKVKKSIFSMIFQDLQILKIVACIGISLVGYNIFYFGMQGSMEKSKNSYGVTMLIAGAHEFIGFFISGVFIQKIKRKSGLIICNLLASLAGLCFLLPVVQENSFLQTLIISLSTIMTVFSFSLSSVLQTQSFPSTIKSTAIGITSGFSQIGRIFVPFLLNLANKFNLHPFIMSSAIYLILGTIPLFFIRETQEQEEEQEEDDAAQEPEEQTSVGKKQFLEKASLSRSASMVLKNMKYEKKLEDYEKKIKNNLYFTPTKED